MEIVITIEEVNYNVACDLASDICPTTFRGLIYKAIANGTVLPKGHGRLVDENPVIAHLVYRDHLIADNVKCGEVAKIFDNAVVIEADKG